MIERGRAQHDFWSKWRGQCGVPKLKEALSAVPKDKYVQWNNWPPKFQYPSYKFCEEVEEFTKTKGLRLEISPAVDAPMFSDWQPY